MKIRGIKRGQTIELLEPLNNIPDGTEVILEIQSIQLMSDEERRLRLKCFETDWESIEEVVKAMEELEKEKDAEQERLYS